MLPGSKWVISKLLFSVNSPIQLSPSYSFSLSLSHTLFLHSLNPKTISLIIPHSQLWSPLSLGLSTYTLPSILLYESHTDLWGVTPPHSYDSMSPSGQEQWFSKLIFHCDVYACHPSWSINKICSLELELCSSNTIFSLHLQAEFLHLPCVFLFCLTHLEHNTNYLYWKHLCVYCGRPKQKMASKFPTT